MSAIDRFEGRVPELMDELAPRRVPDYVDDILQATAGVRQRPAWSSIERWLPVQLAAREGPFGLPSWRPFVLVLVIVGVLIALGAVVLAGSRPRIPAPFGLAKNGLVLYGDTAGDIRSVDAATGSTALVIGGATNDNGPWLSPDGSRFIFFRADDETLYLANADGSGVRAFSPSATMGFWQWSPGSERIVAVPDGGGQPAIIDVASGVRTPLTVSQPIGAAWWLGEDRLLLQSVSKEGETLAFWTINADGTGQAALRMPEACCGTSVLPGSGLVAWTSFGASGAGRIHLLDTTSGAEKLLASTQVAGKIFEGPTLSPDGRWLTASQYLDSVPGTQLVLLRADGTGGALPLGPKIPGNDSINALFSPDGTKLLARYPDGVTYLFSLPDGTGGPVDWPGVLETSWQRLGQ